MSANKEGSFALLTWTTDCCVLSKSCLREVAVLVWLTVCAFASNTRVVSAREEEEGNEEDTLLLFVTESGLNLKFVKYIDTANEATNNMNAPTIRAVR